MAQYVDVVLQFLADAGAGPRARFQLGVLLVVALLLCTGIYGVVRWRRNAGRADGLEDDEAASDDDARDPAVAALDAALAADPLAVDKRGARALHYLQKDRSNRAIQDLHVWVAQAPASADAYRYRGDAWRKLGCHDLALADYRRALRLEPSNAGARDGLKAILPANIPLPPARPVPTLASLFEAELQGRRRRGGPEAPHEPRQTVR